MDINEMRILFRERKTQGANDKAKVKSDAYAEALKPAAQQVSGVSNDIKREELNTDTECVKDTKAWKDATQKAINLLYQLEKCNYAERKESLASVESIEAPVGYEIPWEQILRIWRTFVKKLELNTNTLPNPEGVKYSSRPFPIKGSSGVQDIIKEIAKNV